MKNQPALNWLIPLVGILALVTALAGLFWPVAGSPVTFTSLHGMAVEMYGQSLYRYDSLFSGAAFRGTDAVTLILGLPLLILGAMLYRRGSLRGGLLLGGTLAYFLYNGVSMAFGAAYNSLFLLYTALFSASLFAFVLSLASIDLDALPAHVSEHMPRRGIAVFLFVAGLLTSVVWLSDILVSLTQGRVPELLAGYTTMVTYVIDLGVIVPAALLSGFLLLRRAALGYLLAPSLLLLCAMIGAIVVGQTLMQLSAGVAFAPGQLIGMVGSWVILSGFAAALTLAYFRNISEAAPERSSDTAETYSVQA